MLVSARDHQPRENKKRRGYISQVASSSTFLPAYVLCNSANSAAVPHSRVALTCLLTYKRRREPYFHQSYIIVCSVHTRTHSLHTNATQSRRTTTSEEQRRTTCRARETSAVVEVLFRKTFSSHPLKSKTVFSRTTRARVREVTRLLRTNRALIATAAPVPLQISSCYLLYANNASGLLLTVEWRQPADFTSCNCANTLRRLTTVTAPSAAA